MDDSLFHQELDFDREFVGVPVAGQLWRGLPRCSQVHRHPRGPMNLKKWKVFSKRGYEKRLEISEVPAIKYR